MIQYEKPNETTMERIRREREEQAEAYRIMEKRARMGRREIISMCIAIPVIFFTMLALYAFLSPIQP